MCHLPGEKGQGVIHAVIVRARPGSRAFFYPSGQNLVKWLHLPAKEAEKAPRSTAKSTFQVERRLNNGGCLILAAFGVANMWVAIIADVGVMILAVLNAIRCLFVKNL